MVEVCQSGLSEVPLLVPVDYLIQVKYSTLHGPLLDSFTIAPRLCHLKNGLLRMCKCVLSFFKA